MIVAILAHFRPTLAKLGSVNGYKLHIFGPTTPSKGTNGGPTHGPTVYWGNWWGLVKNRGLEG